MQAPIPFRQRLRAIGSFDFFARFGLRIIVISIGSLLFVSVVTASPCECFRRPHRKDFRQAKTILIGRVVDVSPNPSSEDQSGRIPPYAIKLAVEKVWKGKKISEIIVVTENRATCDGFEFREGERYLVYAYGKNLLAFSGCTRSGMMEPQTQCTAKNISQLNSFWFRLFARLIPF